MYNSGFLNIGGNKRKKLPKKNLISRLPLNKVVEKDGKYYLDDKQGKSDRPVQQGRCYLFDGENDYITVPGLLTTDTITAESTIQPTCTVDGRLDGTGKIFNIKIYRAGNLWAWYKTDEQEGNTAFDSSGNGNHGVIVGTIDTFHAIDNRFKSFQNEEGYALKDGVAGLIPLGLNSEPVVDNCDTVYKGRVKYMPQIKGQYEGHFDGVGHAELGTKITYQHFIRRIKIVLNDITSVGGIWACAGPLGEREFALYQVESKLRFSLGGYDGEWIYNGLDSDSLLAGIEYDVIFSWDGSTMRLQIDQDVYEHDVLSIKETSTQERFYVDGTPLYFTGHISYSSNEVDGSLVQEYDFVRLPSSNQIPDLTGNGNDLTYHSVNYISVNTKTTYQHFIRRMKITLSDTTSVGGIWACAGGSGEREFSLYQVNSKLRFSLGGYNGEWIYNGLDSDPLIVGIEYDIMFSWDGSTMKLQIDQQEYSHLPLSIKETSTKERLGSDSTPLKFNGIIKECTTNIPKNNVLDYDFSTGSGLTLFDKSPERNHAEIIGTTEDEFWEQGEGKCTLAIEGGNWSEETGFIPSCNDNSGLDATGQPIQIKPLEFSKLPYTLTMPKCPEVIKADDKKLWTDENENPEEVTFEELDSNSTDQTFANDKQILVYDGTQVDPELSKIKKYMKI